MLGVHVDSQAVYGGFLGALMGIGLDRIVTDAVGSK